MIYIKALILAAGQGTRLRPITDDRPKCLVEINGISILDRQLKVYRECGIHDISIVKGYKAERITQDIAGFFNQSYNSTNMVSSLMCAREILDKDLILSYGDIVFSPDVLKACMQSIQDFNIVVDIGWKEYWSQRFDDPLSDAESLVIDHDRIIDIGKKVHDYNKIMAQYIGLMKFSEYGIKELVQVCSELKSKDHLIDQYLGVSKRFEHLYMTDLLQILINMGYKITPVFIDRGWFEIDDMKDLEVAEAELL